MATTKQVLGSWGEDLIAKACACPRCKRVRVLRRLPPNFKCADLICDFCGFLAQVKSMNVRAVEPLPRLVLGAAWEPQRERMVSAIYFPLFLVLKAPAEVACYYLPADYQRPELFVPRKPLSGTARRAGWQGFVYDLSVLPSGALVRIL